MANGISIQDRIFGMSAFARAALEQLFLNGPTWDGDLVSKSGRGELVALEYADRGFGMNWLTRKGVEFGVKSMELDRAKERRARA